MKTLCILVRTVGPYHHARFNVLSVDYCVHVFETRPNIGEYDWATVGSTNRFYNLHSNQIIEKKESIRSLIGYLNNLKPDLIITHGWADFEYLVAVVFAKNTNTPIITLTDSTLIDYKRKWIKELLKRTIAKCFDGYLAAGTRSIQYLNSLGIKRNIFTPCDVIDNDYFIAKTQLIRSREEKKTINLPAKYILCVSRLIPKKNILMLLSSYSEVLKTQNNYKYSLVIVGSGYLKKEIEDKIGDLKLGNRAFLFDFAQYNQLPQFYAGASALIIPSLSDQWGLVVNEAMASGLPVLVSENCGCSVDLVEIGMNGFTFQPILENIVKVLSNFDELDDKAINIMGKESLRIIKNYSLLVFLETINRIINVHSNKISLLKRLYLKTILSI